MIMTIINKCYLCGRKNQISPSSLSRWDYRCKPCLADLGRKKYRKYKKKRSKVNKELLATYKKIAKKETNPKLRQRALDLIQSARRMGDKHEELIAQKAHYFRGKCDWCGGIHVQVTYDYETEIESGSGEKRFALICADCDSALPF